MSNPNTALNLDQAVAEVLGLLTGIDLQYTPESDRYQSITRAINRALRSNALEHEWSWYASVQDIGTATAGEREISLPASLRPRIINDDSVRLVDDEDNIRMWAYFLPRDALHKYAYYAGLWCSSTRSTLVFNRAFSTNEDGLNIQVPVMREPYQFVLPAQPEMTEGEPVPVPATTRESLVDFWYPDLIILRAAFYYAQTDPVMQPRVQTLEAQYKDLMYQVLERDDRNTDSPLVNAYDLGISGGIDSSPLARNHGHPHA